MPTTSTALAPRDLEKVFQNETLQLLDWPVNGYDKVRLEWPMYGQPAWKIKDDVAFLRATQEDNEYDKIRDVVQLSNPDAAHVQFQTTYVRVWRIFWSVMGPNSFDMVRQIKSGLFGWDSHDRLALSNLYAVTNFPAPQRLYELYDAGWWIRTDFEAHFNEFVTELDTEQSVASVEVKIIKESGLSIDFTVGDKT